MKGISLMSQPTTPTKNKKHSVADLEGLYSDADGVDQPVFAEMRSSLLLIAGEHYTKKNSQFYNRVKDSKELNDQQKVRLTKNHIQKITKSYANNIVSLLPGVGFEPKNESEMQDQKAAELHHAVWMDASDRQNLDEKKDEWCDDFIGTGEVATKIFWDPSAGPIVAFHAEQDELGQDVQGPDGQLKPDYSRPKYRGDLMFEDLYAFNLLRDPNAKSMKESNYLIIRKMVKKDKLLPLVGDDEAKKKFIQPSSDQTFVVFDAERGGYRNSKDEVLLKEIYFKPCAQYPRGYFYFHTESGILAEGELPGGIFPIVWQYFDKLPTLARGRGPVKTMRPYQVEINRCASKMAEHQATLGDDKLLIQNGTKISAGVALPGVRSINYTGMEPGVLSGRDGSQYLATMQANITELYQVMSVAEDMEADAKQLDPFLMLFRAASQKKRFSRYIKRFERFLIEVARTYIKLAKVHLPDDAIIHAIGRSEQVNIAEFKNTTDLACEITITAQSDDVETKLGKQIMLNHVLQYVGTQLDKRSIGKIIRAMPYANEDETFSDLTLDEDCAKNDILALERGDLPEVHEYDDHVYTVQKLASRMRQADFKYLPSPVQQNYATLIQQHEAAEVEKQRKILAAKSEYIPADGYMVTCQMYTSDPAHPEKQPKLVRVPYSALSWLVKQLEAQGQSLEELEKMNQGAVAQMSGMLVQNHGGAPNGMGGPPNSGAGMPGGVADGSRNGSPGQQQSGFGSGNAGPGPSAGSGWSRRPVAEPVH